MTIIKNLAQGDRIEHNGMVHVVAHADITIATRSAGDIATDKLPFRGSMTACRLSTRRERREVTLEQITCLQRLVWGPDDKTD